MQFGGVMKDEFIKGVADLMDLWPVESEEKTAGPSGKGKRKADEMEEPLDSEALDLNF
jgi:hypothetical protein